MLIKFSKAAIACLLLQWSVLALAHTAAISTSPKTGAVLDSSPAEITITFKEAARLTSVIVQQEGKPDRKLEFAPSTSAAEFKIANPQLEVGRSHVRWTALSKDGHVVKGLIDLTVKPVAAN